MFKVFMSNPFYPIILFWIVLAIVLVVTVKNRNKELEVKHDQRVAIASNISFDIEYIKNEILCSNTTPLIVLEERLDTARRKYKAHVETVNNSTMDSTLYQLGDVMLMFHLLNRYELNLLLLERAYIEEYRNRDK